MRNSLGTRQDSDTEFLGKTSPTGQRTLLPAVPRGAHTRISHNTQSVIRSDKSEAGVYYQSRMERWAPSSSHHPLSLNMPTSLDQLKQTGTVVVSDSGDFECAFLVFVLLGVLRSLNVCELAIDVYKPQASSKGLAVSHHGLGLCSHRMQQQIRRCYLLRRTRPPTPA